MLSLSLSICSMFVWVHVFTLILFLCLCPPHVWWFLCLCSPSVSLSMSLSPSFVCSLCPLFLCLSFYVSFVCSLCVSFSFYVSVPLMEITALVVVVGLGRLLLIVIPLLLLLLLGRAGVFRSSEQHAEGAVPDRGPWRLHPSRARSHMPTSSRLLPIYWNLNSSWSWSLVEVEV